MLLKSVFSLYTTVLPPTWQLMAAVAPQGPRWGDYHPMWGMWGMWGFIMPVIMIIFWVLIIVGIVLGIRWLVTNGKRQQADSALEILRQRYARGEIQKEEFEAKKRDLSP